MNILEMLMEVNDGVNWEDILGDIEDWVGEYYDAIAKRLDNPEQYLREVLPEYWQAVRANDIYQWGKARHPLPSLSDYGVGIFLIGFSSLPIVLSIAEIQPCQKIYFLHSGDTESKCDEVTYRIEEMLVDPPHPFDPLITPNASRELINRVRNAKRCKITNPSDPVETFKQIKEIIDEVRGELGTNTNIALDLTGGKKTMIGGGFTAGSIYSLAPKCDMFYVDSLEYDASRGVPIPGTEFLSRLDNPYDVYNVQSVQEAKALFKRHNYEGAEQLWKSVRDKLDDHATRYHFLENERKEAKEYYGSSHCYHPWDALDYDTAKNRRKYRKDRREYLWGYHDAHTFGKIDALNILAKVIDKRTLFRDECTVIHYAVDRYQNGMRRKQVRRLADAIVRFAQVIEIICNYRIYRLAQDNDFVNIVSGAPKNLPPNRIWEFGTLIRLLFGGRVDIGHATYHVLQAHQMQVGDYGYRNVDGILSIIQPRNDFIHFNTSMKQAQAETDAESLRDLAYKFLEKFIGDYCGDYCLSLNDLLELHKFRR